MTIGPAPMIMIDLMSVRLGMPLFGSRAWSCPKIGSHFSGPRSRLTQKKGALFARPRPRDRARPRAAGFWTRRGGQGRAKAPAAPRHGRDHATRRETKADWRVRG